MWTFNVTGLGLSAGNLRTDLLPYRLPRAREPAPLSGRSWIRVPNGRGNSMKKAHLPRKSSIPRLTQQASLELSLVSTPRRARRASPRAPPVRALAPPRPPIVSRRAQLRLGTLFRVAAMGRRALGWLRRVEALVPQVDLLPRRDRAPGRVAAARPARPDDRGSGAPPGAP
jgi:hypothetical protein